MDNVEIFGGSRSLLGMIDRIVVSFRKHGVRHAIWLVGWLRGLKALMGFGMRSVIDRVHSTSD